MTTQIWDNGKELDLYSDTNIKHVRKVNDITALAIRQFSFTDLFSVPKTPNNIQIFEGLSIPSDTSVTPYSKSNCVMKIEGFTFIEKGWLNIREVNEDHYKVYVFSGIINFAKKIENKTLGDNDLGIIELNHNKNLQTVIDSFDNPYYKYLITDYNGRTHYGDQDSIINIDHLVPSVSVEYLWKKVHYSNGFTYSGKIFETELFKNLWITFPKFIDNESLKEIANNSGTKYLGATNIDTSDENNYYQHLQVDGYAGRLYFRIPEDADYKLTFSIQSNPRGGRKQYLLCVNQQDVPFSQRSYVPIVFTDDGNLDVSKYIKTPLQEGDLVSIVVKFDRIPNGVIGWEASYQLKWEQFTKGSVLFSDELKGLTVKDFFKEVINHFGLTMLSDEFSNNIEYLTLEERINEADLVDWTEKYLSRTSENYLYGSYAQNNIFSYQYNDKESNYNDSMIPISNKNLEEKKTVFKSKMYSPERDYRTFKINQEITKSVSVFKFYEKEIEEKEGRIEIKYKGLEKRFHFVRERMLEANAVLGSFSLGKSQEVSSLPMASFKDLHFRDVIGENYNIFSQIINDSRMHDIELALDYIDLLQVDFKKLYYFGQEQQYYMLNKLDFDNNKAKGEFVRVKRTYEPIEPIDPVDPVEPFVNIVWEDDTNGRKIGDRETIVCKRASSHSQNNDSFVSQVWERSLDENTWDNSQIHTDDFMVYLHLGVNWIRLKSTTQSGAVIYSNILIYERIFYLCKEYTALTYDFKDLIVEYMGCNGIAQRVTKQGHQYTTRHNFCAKEGSVTTNGQLHEYGMCNK